MSFTWHHSCCIFGSFQCRHRIAGVCALGGGVSTDGPGGTGGTGRSAETRRSSLVCSGTVRTPEHCFGNSGENWSARGRKQEKKLLRNKEKLLTMGWRNGPFSSEAPGSDPTNLVC